MTKKTKQKTHREMFWDALPDARKKLSDDLFTAFDAAVKALGIPPDQQNGPSYTTGPSNKLIDSALISNISWRWRDET